MLLNPAPPLADGSYEVEVTPRDLIGNTGQTLSFGLIVDRVPPALVILSSAEAQTDREKLRIEGMAEDAYLAALSIYDNERLVESFTPAGTFFTKEIPLSPGNNEIRVEAVDRAGNRSSQKISVYADLVRAAALVAKYGNAPNPFSPRGGEATYFTYNLTAAAELKIYIFNLAGILLWKKEISNATAGGTPWNGVDQFGAAVQNGVYPYIIQAAAGGAIEIKRGKVIVLQ